jgi:hypothetical protein
VENHHNSPEAELDAISSTIVSDFTKLLRERLLDQEVPISKDYLKLLITQIFLNGDEVTVKGRLEMLARVIHLEAEKRIR